MITENSTDTALAPVAEDMSAFVIAGAVTSQHGESEYDTVSRTPAQGIQDGVDAERIGFRRIWLSERIDIKWSQLCTANGWDLGLLDKIRSHKRFEKISQVADREFQRHEMMDVASVIPDEYIWDCSAIGTVDECVANLRRFIDAGADEIVTYGSTPAQNAELVAAWRDRDR